MAIPVAAYYAMAGATALTGWMGSKSAKKGQRASNAMLQKQLDFQKEQQAKLDKQKEVYRQFKFENPYAGMENPYEGMQTQFENVYEDLKVSTEAADFQMEQGAQQRANIMQSLRGAAGGSGIAGLAQSLANQGQLQARQVSVSIAQQERQNEMAKAGGAASARQLQMGREQLIAQGASAVDMAQRGGEAMVQEAEMSRQATLLGVAYGGAAGAGAGVQAAYANQMAANSAAMQMQTQNISSFGNVMSKMPWDQMSGQPNYSTTQYTPGGTEFTIDPSAGYDWSTDPQGFSDRRLKKDIELIGESPSGLNIYSFKYIDSKYGEGTYQGVMSDETPSYAVSVNSDGYDMVNYSKIDVNFKQI